MSATGFTVYCPLGKVRRGGPDFIFQNQALKRLRLSSPFVQTVSFGVLALCCIQFLNTRRVTTHDIWLDKKMAAPIGSRMRPV
jgi:hypothetical protein